MIRAAIFFKNAAYETEREYRFLQIRSIRAPTADILARPRGANLVKYVEYDWKSVVSNSLKEIIVGPAAPNDAESIVEAALKMSGFEPRSINIERSLLPYRVW